MASKPVLLFFFYFNNHSCKNILLPSRLRVKQFRAHNFPNHNIDNGSRFDTAEKLRGIFIYFARRCGPGGTRPIRKPGGPPAEEEEESVEIGRKRRGNWRREEKMVPSLLNYWTVHSGSFAYSNIYTDSILPPVLLSPSGLPREVGRGEGRLRARGRVVARIPRCKLFHDSFRGGSRLEFA